MAKAKTKVRTSIKIVMIDGEINGKPIVPVNYQRTEFSNGTIEEAGTRPQGTNPTSTLGEILAAAFAQVQSPAKTTAAKKARR